MPHAPTNALTLELGICYKCGLPGLGRRCRFYRGAVFKLDQIVKTHFFAVNNSLNVYNCVSEAELSLELDQDNTMCALSHGTFFLLAWNRISQKFRSILADNKDIQCWWSHTSRALIIFCPLPFIVIYLHNNSSNTKKKTNFSSYSPKIYKSQYRT